MRKISKEEKAVAESHTMWAIDIHKRNERYSDDSNWWPFVENINQMLDRFTELEQRIAAIDNRIGETQGMIKNLRKILIKLEVIDDRFIF
tara:strand:+ start:16 stop:285 length:270 start_codon:yes stop_codon:yes gene_type:complete